MFHPTSCYTNIEFLQRNKIQGSIMNVNAPPFYGFNSQVKYNKRSKSTTEGGVRQYNGSIKNILMFSFIILVATLNQGMTHVEGKEETKDFIGPKRTSRLYNDDNPIIQKSNKDSKINFNIDDDTDKTASLSSLSSSSSGFSNSDQQYASFEELQKLAESPFENNTSINITVPLGDTAFLRCKVRNLGERSISWVRRRDWHILTSGKTAFSNDERFNVLHADGSDEWTLQIKFVQRRDNGTYECQVSTGTGIVSYLVHLMVAVPEAFILGNGEYHIEQGSTISLVCIIEKSPKPPEYIFWYHNERMINYGSDREVKVLTEPGSKTHSRLTIRNAGLSDSGNYSCKTAHADPASTLVYVSQGDQIAAISRRKSAKSGAPETLIPLLSSSLLSILIMSLRHYFLAEISCNFSFKNLCLYSCILCFASFLH